jgi:hypothetical protein
LLQERRILRDRPRGLATVTTRPKRPSDEDYARALALYRGNAPPEQIAERVGLSLDQVEHAMLEGWPPTRGRHPRPALRAWEHEIDDRMHRARLATLDWAQAVAESSAVSAKDWAATLKKCSAIKQSMLNAWGLRVKKAIEDADGKAPDLDGLSIDLNFARSLRTLHLMMDPGQQGKIADVHRALAGDEDDADVGADDRLAASLAGMTEEQIDHWVETNKRPDPDQKVLPFPQQDAG